MDDHVTSDTRTEDRLVDAAAPRDLLELERQVCFALAVASRSVTELSHRLQLEPATLSPLLRRLEAVGYLRRERVVGNERTLRLTLTTEGAALRERALAIPEAVMSRLQINLAEA